MLNLTGKTFGKLTALEPVGKYKRYIIWKCKCDCGNTTTALAYKLKLGRKKSCGCLLKREGRWNWSGCKELSGFAWRRVLNAAASRNIKVKMTVREAWELFEKQNRKCSLTGEELSFCTKPGLYDGTASLDRIDSSKGYTLDNVQWVHKKINTMKWDLKQDDFIKWCKKVSSYK